MLFIDVIKKKAYAIAIIFIFVFTVFYPSLSGRVIDLDDTEMVTDLNDPIRDYSMGKIFSNQSINSYYRPVLMASYVLDYKIWMFEYSGYHLTNMVMHFINAVLMYFLGLLVFKSIRNKEIFALVSALIFSMHPLSVESVAWISGRSDILGTMFSLLALMSYLSKIRFRLGIMGVFLLFGFLSKENALAMIPVIAFWEISSKVGQRDLKSVIKSFPNVVVFLLAPFGVYMYMKLFGFGSLPEQALEQIQYGKLSPERLGLDWSFLLNIPAVTAFYLKKLIIPYPLNFAITSINITLYSVIFIVLACFFAVMIKQYRSYRLSFWVIVCVLSFTPAYLVLYMKCTWTPYAERYLYLSIVIFALAVAEGIAFLTDRYPTWNNCIMTVTLVALTVMTVTTFHRNYIWRDKVSIWEDTLAKNPNSGKVLFKSGCVFATVGQYGRLIENARKVIEVADNADWKDEACFVLARYEIKQKNYPLAVEYLRQAVNVQYKRANYYETIKLLKEMTDVPRKARVENLTFAVSLYRKMGGESRPNDLYAMAELFLEIGDDEQAVQAFEKIIQNFPKQPLAQAAKKRLEYYHDETKAGI